MTRRDATRAGWRCAWAGRCCTCGCPRVALRASSCSPSSRSSRSSAPPRSSSPASEVSHSGQSRGGQVRRAAGVSHDPGAIPREAVAQRLDIWGVTQVHLMLGSRDAVVAYRKGQVTWGPRQSGSRSVWRPWSSQLV